ncbi:MAG: recombinase RecT, partial [Oscillospiraceae bacterium]|nr:recombinase RecT [Oscillospiraceae bacterium]
IKRIVRNENNSNHQYDNTIPYDWEHVNMRDLALDAVHAARMGLDMQEEAHLYPIPYANKKKGCYDITFVTGYAGKQYKATKYALKPPKAVYEFLKALGYEESDEEAALRNGTSELYAPRAEDDDEGYDDEEFDEDDEE